MPGLIGGDMAQNKVEGWHAISPNSKELHLLMKIHLTLDLGYSRLFRSILIPNAVPVDPCGVLLYKPRPFRVHR